MGRTKRTIRNMGLAGGAGLLAAALVVPPAGAATSNIQTIKNEVSGSASGQALFASILGRSFSAAGSNVTGAVDNVASKLDLTAGGLGIGLSPTTSVQAGMDVINKDAKKGCASAPLSALLDKVSSTLDSTPLKGALPTLTADIACGSAGLTGDINNFTAQGLGQVADVKVALAPAVQSLISQVHSAIDTQILTTPVGQVVDSTNQAAKDAVTAINGLLAQKLGLGVQLPVLDAKQTVGDLLNRLADSNLAEISIGKSLAKNVGDTANFSSIAHDDAGTISILPHFRGANSPALVTIKIAESEAKVDVVRDTANAVGTAKNTIVKVESELLPDLSLSALGLGNTPLETLTNTLGYTAGKGFIEVAPGQDLTLFAGTPLESTISVSKATKPEVLSNGHLKVTASAADIHLFKGLNSLVPGVELGTILANPQVDAALAPITKALGVSLGQVTNIPGIQLTFAKAEAEAGAVKVTQPLPQVAATQVTKLPRTGGFDMAPVALPMLLGGAGGLRVMMRRRRRTA